MHAHWPIVDGTGTEPTPAQKIISHGGQPFWSNKPAQDDTFTPDPSEN